MMNDNDSNESSGSESASCCSCDEQQESFEDSSEDKLASESTKRLQIVVKCVGNGDNDSLELRVETGASVLDLKRLISEEMAAKNDQVPVDRQRLMYFGRMLRDNDELLGDKGVKMQTNSINYVHLSPLPKGAKPSKRSSVESSATRSLGARIERARRLGTAARERIRRRAQPYDTSRRRRSTERVRREERESVTSQQPEDHSFLAFATASDPLRVPLPNPQVFTLPMTHALPPILAPLQPPISPFEQISRLTATVAAANREALTSRPHLTEQVRQASRGLIPTLGLLDVQLRHLSTAQSLEFGAEQELLETVTSLDRVAQDASALSLAIRNLVETRSLAQPQPLAFAPVIAQSAAIVSLDQLLTEPESSRGALYPDGAPSMLFPSSYFSHML